MPAILLIGERETAAIAAAIERARKKPVTLEWLRQWGVRSDQQTGPMKLDERKPGFRRPPSQQVLIPIGYRAAVSFEEQPEGIAIHLSVSVERQDPKWMPGVPAVNMIAEAFGISAADLQRAVVWMEEYEPGRHAVNIVVITEPKQEGHA